MDVSESLYRECAALFGVCSGECYVDKELCIGLFAFGHEVSGLIRSRKPKDFIWLHCTVKRTVTRPIRICYFLCSSC